MSISAVIDATTYAISTDRANADVTFTAEASLVGVTEVAFGVRQHRLTIDEPASLGGGDTAINPVEAVLVGLGSCQAIAYRFWATKLDIAFDNISVTTRGELDLRGFFGLDDAIRPGFQGISYDVTISGPESPERYRQLAAAVDAHCPVLDTVSNPTPLRNSLTIR